MLDTWMLLNLRMANLWSEVVILGTFPCFGSLQNVNLLMVFALKVWPVDSKQKALLLINESCMFAIVKSLFFKFVYLMSTCVGVVRFICLL
jgi:hypothetical protein